MDIYVLYNLTVRVPQVAILRTCPNMTLAVERDVKTPTLTFDFDLQPYTHLTLKLLIQGHPRSAKVTHIADFKSGYISLIIGPRGLQYETNL